MDLINVVDPKAADHAIDRGIKYLLSLNVNGRWKGFPTLAGESDIWVTGFVLAHIYNLSQQANVIKESQDFLLRSRHPSGGWSYSASVPPDADSTAWCLIALQLTGAITEPVLEEARTFMWNHFNGSGVSTYTSESGIREFISAPAGYPLSGWTGAHPDVSIAAVLADPQSEKVPEIINWLSDQQTKEGFINSYWWLSSYYTTTLLLRALSGDKKQVPEEHAKIIAASMVRDQLADGGFSVYPELDPGLVHRQAVMLLPPPLHWNHLPGYLTWGNTRKEIYVPMHCSNLSSPMEVGRVILFCVSLLLIL